MAEIASGEVLLHRKRDGSRSSSSRRRPAELISAVTSSPPQRSGSRSGCQSLSITSREVASGSNRS